jgi:hypothetical protein
VWWVGGERLREGAGRPGPGILWSRALTGDGAHADGAVGQGANSGGKDSRKNGKRGGREIDTTSR